eukprot:Clim_evm23s238 gene=Clim_evmTU23s238
MKQMKKQTEELRAKSVEASQQYETMRAAVARLVGIDSRGLDPSDDSKIISRVDQFVRDCPCFNDMVMSLQDRLRHFENASIKASRP